MQQRDGKREKKGEFIHDHAWRARGTKRLAQQPPQHDTAHSQRPRTLLPVPFLATQGDNIRRSAANHRWLRTSAACPYYCGDLGHQSSDQSWSGPVQHSAGRWLIDRERTSPFFFSFFFIFSLFCNLDQSDHDRGKKPPGVTIKSDVHLQAEGKTNSEGDEEDEAHKRWRPPDGAGGNESFLRLALA